MTSYQRMGEVDVAIDSRLPEFIEDLRMLCALPSVSTYDQALPETAAVTRDLHQR